MDIDLSAILEEAANENNQLKDRFEALQEELGAGAQREQAQSGTDRQRASVRGLLSLASVLLALLGLSLWAGCSHETSCKPGCAAKYHTQLHRADGYRNTGTRRPGVAHGGRAGPGSVRRVEMDAV